MAKGITFPRLAAAVLVLLATAIATNAVAERIKDLASIQGVRPNQLVGYGLVVGLDNSGDQTTQTPFTVQGVVNMLSQLGINLPADRLSTIQLKNVAAVMVTASLPAFASPGQSVDIVVSSLGNAKSLRGGTLLMTPLKGADGEIYAMAQGNVAVGGAGASGGGSKAQINHLSAGRVPAGATVERAVSTSISRNGAIQLELNVTDFATATRVAQAINGKFGEGVAQALDGRVIRVSAPDTASRRVALIGEIENIEVSPAQGMAKVIVNSRTGSIVMNQTVRVDTCAVAHGNLSVVVNTENAVSQPAPLSAGQTAAVANTQIELTQQPGSLVVVPAGVSLGDVVKALNAVGAAPLDLIAILQAMKAAGALRAELEII